MYISLHPSPITGAGLRNSKITYAELRYDRVHVTICYGTCVRFIYLS
jgi:hypothetical protein